MITWGSGAKVLPFTVAIRLGSFKVWSLNAALMCSTLGVVAKHFRMLNFFFSEALLKVFNLYHPLVQKNVSHFFSARVWEMCTVEVPEKKGVRDIFHYNMHWFRRIALQTIQHNTINNLVCSHIIWPSFPQSHLKHTMHSFFSKLIIDISLHLIAMTSAPWNF